MKNRKLTVIILAAGKGTRMNSPLPKVLHPVAGRPMIERVIRTCQKAGAEDVRVVVGHAQQLVSQVILPLGVTLHQQKHQLGTGDAVRSADLTSLEDDVLILNGDHPLIEAEDILDCLRVFREEKYALAVVTAKLKKPGDLGRIIRHRGELHSIVEVKDASSDTLKINEVNTGLYFVDAETLQEYIPLIENQNAKNEFYLTDIISIAKENGERVDAIQAKPRVARGVNSQMDLAFASKMLFRKKAKDLMEQGVVMIDPMNCYIEEGVEVGRGTVLYPNVYLRGSTKIGSYCMLEPQTYMVDCTIADGVQIRSNCYLEQTHVQEKASIGPFARLRPGTDIGVEAHVGNFVEMKKTKFGARSKAGHLSYLGDAEVGTDSNIGCGTITCNYAVDRKKYKTKIGNHVFVGSDSQFVAPVEVGDHVVIGSGSTITKDVPDKALAVARGRQMNKENYVSVAEDIAPRTKQPIEGK